MDSYGVRSLDQDISSRRKMASISTNRPRKGSPISSFVSSEQISVIPEDSMLSGGDREGEPLLSERIEEKKKGRQCVTS